VDQPSIVEVVEAAGVALRRVGREWFGLCPFHSENTPSFAVNEDKNVWCCHGCHEGGDSISFIMKFHGVNFRDALKLLGIEADKRPEPRAVRRRERAKRIAAWARATSNKLNERLHDIDEQRYLLNELRKLKRADSAFIAEEGARLKREWDILLTLDDDLNPWRWHEFTPEERAERIERLRRTGKNDDGKLGTWIPDGARLVEMFESRTAIDALVTEVASGWLD